MEISSSLLGRSPSTLDSASVEARSSKEPVSVGLIGVGGFGRTHLRCLDLLQREGRARLVAVADSSNSLSAEKQELAALGVRWYADYREMLAREKQMQAVQIASPIPLHYEMAAACVDQGLFVQLEKPPVVLIQQLEDLIARDIGEKIAVGFQHIDTIQVQTLKRWILEGKLGRLRDIRVSACWPRSGSYYERSWAGKMRFQGRPVFDGPATNALSHLIHSIMFLSGREKAEFAVPVWVQGEYYRVRPIESYDVVTLRGEFDGGITFNASLTHATERAQPYQIEVHGDRDWACLSEEGMRLEGSAGIHHFSREEQEADAHMLNQRNFLDFVSGKVPRPSTRLRDTRGFVLTINGGLLSSNGIHSVPAHLIRSYGEEPHAGLDLKGLFSLVERARIEGGLFHDLGASWAQPSSKVPLKTLRHFDFDAYCKNEAC